VRAGLIGLVVLVMLLWPTRRLADQGGSAVVVLPGVRPSVLVQTGGTWHTLRPADEQTVGMVEQFVGKLGSRLTAGGPAELEFGPAGVASLTTAGTKVVDLTATSAPNLRELLRSRPLSLVGDVVILHPRLSDAESIAGVLAAARPQYVLCGDDAQLPDAFAGRYSRYGEFAAGLLLRPDAPPTPIDLTAE
jgi:hypothetical protein